MQELLKSKIIKIAVFNQFFEITNNVLCIILTERKFNY